jgi:hypothetical protein
MRKRIILPAMAAVAVIAFVWSISTKPKIAGKEDATEASASISTHDITAKQGNILPVELLGPSVLSIATCDRRTGSLPFLAGGHDPVFRAA